MCRMQRMHLRNLGRTTKMQQYRVEITDVLYTASDIEGRLR